jgi:hypothetical protein
VVQPPERSEATEPPDDDSLISLRAAVIIVVSLLIGIGVGVVTNIATGSPPFAVLAGGAAFPGSMSFLHKLISRRN